MRLKALLFHLRDDTHEINADMCEVFSDLLTRENWELISAYELYLLLDDKEDLVDTLFVIYKMYSGSAILVATGNAGRRRRQLGPEEAERQPRHHLVRRERQTRRESL